MCCEAPGRAAWSGLPLLVASMILAGTCTGAAAHAGEPSAANLQAAPDFSREDLNHATVSLSAFRGKVVLLNFWATWCGPCLAEIPQFAHWQQIYGGRGLQVIGVSMDDAPAPVLAAYEKYRLNYPVVMGDERLGELFGGVYGLPVSYLLDRSGKIQATHKGAVDLNRMEQEIKTLLAQK